METKLKLLRWRWTSFACYETLSAISAVARKFDKTTFEQCLSLAKDAFDALGQDKSKIDEIGKLGDDEFPTNIVSKLKAELKREKDAAAKFKQIADHLDEIESGVASAGLENIESNVEVVKIALKDAKTEVKTALTDVGSEVKDVKTELTDVGSQVKDVKTGVIDVGSAVKEIKAFNHKVIH